ncbi:MAG: metalloregulator ArsR/SmtB family transcription factor [Acidimicrobiia bacterium]
MPRAEANRPVVEPSLPLSVVKAELFKALAHPARVRVLELLAEGERSVGDMQPIVGIELSHLSQQLGVLRKAGVVTARKEGSTVIYAVRDPLVVELLAVARRLLAHTLQESNALLADLDAELASP